MIKTIRSLFRQKEPPEEDAQTVLIAGLGNPEKRYEKTRHNAGFEVIDLLAKEYRIPSAGTQKRAAVGRGVIEGKKVMLAKPLTYMNASGEAVRGLCDYYHIDSVRNLIVISDDVNLPVGTIRIRKKGSAGGHNGLKDIIRHLGHEDFPRVRIGVGGKKGGEGLADHVLSAVPKQEREAMEEALQCAARAVAAILSDGIDRAMNVYNAKPKEKET